MFHYDKTPTRQISFGFISTFGDAEAENYTGLQINLFMEGLSAYLYV